LGERDIMHSSMKGKIVFREEKFGGIIYDSSIPRYTHIKKDQIDTELKKINPDDLIFIKNPVVTNCHLNAPEEIGLDITQKCNLTCPHCYKDSGQVTEDELSTKEILTIIDEAVKAGIFCLFISGGEATCRPDLFEIVKYAHDKGINSILTTNGVYGRETLDKILSANFIKIQISLDGPQKIHDSLRGKGNFEKSVDSIRYLKKNGTKVRINFHICEKNKNSIKEMVDIATDLGVAIKFSTIRPIGRQQETDLKMLTGKELYVAIKEILKFKKQFPEILITCDFDTLVGKIPLYSLSSGRNNRCLAAEKTLTIDSCGNIFPCSFFTPFPEFNAGNVKNGGFMKVWKDSEVFDKLRSRKASKECSSCDHYEKTCRGGCPAIPFALSQSVEMVDPTCPKCGMDEEK
jgi:radical SAM protein with 4Fe4S-binding SPASM domain